MPGGADNPRQLRLSVGSTQSDAGRDDEHRKDAARDHEESMPVRTGRQTVVLAEDRNKSFATNFLHSPLQREEPNCRHMESADRRYRLPSGAGNSAVVRNDFDAPEALAATDMPHGGWIETASLVLVDLDQTVARIQAEVDRLGAVGPV